MEPTESPSLDQGQGSTVNFSPESASQLGVEWGASGYMADPPEGSLHLWVPLGLLRGDEPFSLVFTV